MDLKSFIILMYILTKVVDGLGDIKKFHNAVDQAKGCGGTLTVGDEGVDHIWRATEKGADDEGIKATDLEAVSANSTKLSISDTNEGEALFNSARKLNALDILKTRPSTLFTPDTKPFNILEQLKLDEIRDAQEELLHNSGQLKASKQRKRTKKKKRRRKKNKNKQKPIGEQATIFWTQLTTKKPHYYYQKLTTTTKVPKKVKYIVHKKNVLKKKKKEYLNHLKHVLYPFIKFIALFTVLNPFTLKVFLFALISPVVFGFLGFMALSFMVKPALQLIFDVKKRVDIIKRKHWREKKRRERWRYGRRPITIHKHYYKNVVAPHPPKPKFVHSISRPPMPKWPEWVRSDQIDFRPKLQPQTSQLMIYKNNQHNDRFRTTNFHFNPILPDVEDEIEDWPYESTRFEKYKGLKPPKQLLSTPLQFKPPSVTPINRVKNGPPPFHNKHKAPAPSVSAEFEAAPFL